MSLLIYAAPLYLKRYPSVILAAYIGIIHGGALILLPCLDLPLEFILFLGVIVSISFYCNLQHQALLSSSKAITQVIWDRQGIWFLCQRNKMKYVGELLPSCFVSSHLVVLNFGAGVWWRRVSVALLSDNVDLESLRRLRVRLRVTRS